MEYEDLEEEGEDEEEEYVADPRRRKSHRRADPRRRKRADPRRKRRTYSRADPRRYIKKGSWGPAIKTAAAIDIGALAGKFLASKIPFSVDVAGHSLNGIDLAAGVLGFLAHGAGVKHGVVLNQFGQGMLSAGIGADPAYSAPSAKADIYTAGPIPLPVDSTGL